MLTIPSVWAAEPAPESVESVTLEADKKEAAAAKPAAESRRGALRTGAFEAFSLPDYKVDQAFRLKIREEIAILTRIVKQTKNPNARADRLFRIAELYWLEERSKYLRDMDSYVKAYDAFAAGKRKTKPVEPKFSGQRSFKIYENIIGSAPKYERMDEVLFLAGYHATEVNNKKAFEYFQRLVTQYPNSRFRLDAYMEIGEHYFLERQFDRAIETYSIVLKVPSKLYNFALYKLSWCYYNQAKVRPAMTIMQKVVASSKGVPREIELREEALRDLVLFYSDLGLVEEAQQYFVSIGEPDYGLKVLEKLSNIYFEQARYDKAIVTLKMLLAAGPFAENAPRHHSKLIDSYEKSNDLRRAMGEMENFIATYDKSAAWYTRNTDEEMRDYSVVRSEVYARFIPKKYHEQAQRAERTEPEAAAKNYAAAVVYYQKYLERFGGHKNAYVMRFVYAQLLFKKKDFLAASQQFEIVAKDPKGKYQKEAIVGQIDSLTRLEEIHFKDLEAKGIKQKNKYDPIPLSPYAERLVSADEAYVKHFPKDDRIPDTLLHRSQLLYNYNQFDKAQKGFLAIVQQFPTSAPSMSARHLILDIYNIRKDWENLEKWAATFLTHKEFATAENRALLLKLIQGSIFQRAKQLEDKKQYTAAADTYLRLANKYPESEYADKALFNAAVAYINGDESEKAMATAQRFLAKYPDSPMVPKMMLALASYFDDKLDYEHAANYYELLADKDPKSNYSADALFNAGLYREHLRQLDRAVKDYDLYLQRYPNAKDAGDIYFSLGLIYELRKAWPQTIEVFQNYPRKYGLKKDRIVEAYYRAGQAQEKLRQHEPARRSYQTAVALFRKYNQNPSLGPNVGAKYAAKAQLELIQEMLDEYNEIRLRMPQKVLANAMERKALLLKNLKNKYLEVINYGDAEMGVTALYQIGSIYQNFSKALFNAPVPKELNPEQVQLYQQELANRAAPIEEKAVEAYEKAIAKAYELDVYNDWTDKAYERLTEFKPDKYPPRRGKTYFEASTSEPMAPYKPMLEAAAR
ncbi:MAG TPA: tetratricopeptide repeat protein [Bdellovibrionota bacterium]|nr:tetratricopeptide repeat protein [Bdellovibrionota bacterium]